jgi:hypothetical protein
VKRAVAAAILTGAAWMGLSREAQAQVLITPAGPMALRTRTVEAIAEVPGLTTDGDEFYPGRTMGGGTRILRSTPPPSFLKRRKE